MAYQQNSITALSQILALVYSFAPTAGLTVSGDSTAPVVSINGTGFLLDAPTNGFDQELRWTAQSAPAITSSARTRSPKLNGTTATPAVSAPTKVHMFAAISPTPFLALVIEYGVNSYRHLYLGAMDKVGGYSGGQVLSGCNFTSLSDADAYPLSYRDPSHQYLFSGMQTLRSASTAGGVLVDTVYNAVPFRAFACPASASPIDAMTGAEAFGGFGDDINDAMLARAFCTFGGANLLVPVNLFASQGAGASALFAPLGAPAGVRMVNMDGIDPGVTLTIGTDDWHCFPAFSKKEATEISKSTGGWAVEETSHMVGYAYLAS